MKSVVAVRRQIATLWYRNPAKSLSIIAVAGSYGKTTAARFLEAILKESGKTVAVLANDSDHVFDTSMSNYQKALLQAKKQNVESVIVEVTDGLMSLQALEGTVLECLIIMNDNEDIKKLLALHPRHVVVPSSFHTPDGAVVPHQRISVGVDDEAEAAVSGIKLYRKGTELTMTIDYQTKLEIATYFVGKANAMSLASAIAACYVLGINTAAVQEGVADLEPPKGNFTVLQVDLPYKVVVDGAATATSIEMALDSARQFTDRRLIVAVDETVGEQAYSLLKDKADRVLIVSSSRELPNNVDTCVDAAEAAKLAARGAKQDDYVLLLGRTFAKITREGVTYAEHCIKDTD